LFSDKHTVSEKLSLVNNDNIISSNSDAAQLFITYLRNNLSWKSNGGAQTGHDPVYSAIARIKCLR